MQKLVTFAKLSELRFELLGPVPVIEYDQMRHQSIPNYHTKGLDATIACAIDTKALTNTPGAQVFAPKKICGQICPAAILRPPLFPNGP